ncbi:MAG: alanyl-tRNA editing protein [Anaerolineae bacterium]
MPELIYQTDSYVHEFEATVTAVDSALHAVMLSRTAFYPGGGGQPCDFGTLTVNGTAYRVGKVQKIGTEIAHILEGDVSLPEVGTQALGALDWERRYQLMRTHTAMHILSAVIFRDYGAQVTGGNMEPLEGRMDFEFETLQGDFVREVEVAINREVAAAREVSVNLLPREEAFQIPDLIRTKINLLPEGITEVRTVAISGLDLQADGGTHVANTSEVGTIKVTDYKSKGKINKRIYIRLA